MNQSSEPHAHNSKYNRMRLCGIQFRDVFQFTYLFIRRHGAQHERMNTEETCTHERTMMMNNLRRVHAASV